MLTDDTIPYMNFYNIFIKCLYIQQNRDSDVGSVQLLNLLNILSKLVKLITGIRKKVVTDISVDVIFATPLCEM